MTRLLETVTVLDFSHAVAGPYASRLLADRGATVIKVERPPLGDFLRNFAPSEFPSAANFAYTSAGKLSLCIDLSFEEAKDIIRDLVRHSDVLLENFTPGAIGRLGMDYETVSTINPRIVMCSVSGFGQDGPWRSLRGVDPAIQGWSGIASLMGEPAGSPYIERSAPCDTGTATFAAIAVSAALYSRQRSGQGQYVDLAMLDSALAMDFFGAPAVLNPGKRSVSPRRSGRIHHSGDVAVARGTDCFVAVDIEGDSPSSPWGRLAAAMGRPDLLGDERFVTPAGRIANQSDLLDVLDAWLCGFADDHRALEALQEAGVCAAPVRHPWEVVAAPEVEERLIRRVVQADGRVILTMATPGVFTGQKATVGAAPRLGEHNEDVLCGLLGLDREYVADLTARGVLYSEAPAHDGERSAS